MKKFFQMAMPALLLAAILGGCSAKTELDPDDPVTLTMWHVYGEQADSPMNRLVTQFNETAGKEKGIVIDVTRMTNARDIGNLLISAKEGKPGAPEMPDLFSGHAGNAASLGNDAVIDWNDWFSEEERNAFVPDFLSDGMLGDSLAVLPVSKSTHLLFLNGSQFARFSADTGVTESDLSTWNGLFSASAQYYDWSGGKPMCVFDYLIRAVELNAAANGADNFYSDIGWYDTENEQFKTSYLTFMEPLVQGHIAVADLYSNTQVMTGETLAGIGSSAAILYYNDVVTYPDNTTEPTNLIVLPFPQAENGKQVMTQAGVGLCASKTTSQKAEAASVFAHWLTEPERNLSFVVETGYMPVCKKSFDKMETYDFPDSAHKALYHTLDAMRSADTALSEPSRSDYYNRVYTLYDQLRQMQPEWKKRAENGERVDVLTSEAWDLFCAVE